MQRQKNRGRAVLRWAVMGIAVTALALGGSLGGRTDYCRLCGKVKLVRLAVLGIDMKEEQIDTDLSLLLEPLMPYERCGHTWVKGFHRPYWTRLLKATGGHGHSAQMRVIMQGRWIFQWIAYYDPELALAAGEALLAPEGEPGGMGGRYSQLGSSVQFGSIPPWEESQIYAAVSRARDIFGLPPTSAHHVFANRAGASSINEWDLTLREWGMTPLHWAVRSGDTWTVKGLLRRGADVDAQDKWGQTSLHLAASLGYVEIVRALLGHGAQSELADDQRSRALHFAAMQNALDIVELLLDRGADVQATDGAGRTALHLAAAGGHTQAMLLLLRQGADGAAASKRGWTPLHFACDKGQLRAVELLLAAGVEASAKDAEAKTPLDLALRGGHRDVAKLFRQHVGVE